MLRDERFDGPGDSPATELTLLVAMNNKFTNNFASIAPLIGEWLEYSALNWTCAEYLLTSNDAAVMYLQRAHTLGRVGGRPRAMCNFFIGELISERELPRSLKWLGVFGAGSVRNSVVTVNGDVLASQLRTNKIFRTDPYALPDGQKFYWGVMGLKSYSILDEKKEPVVVGERDQSRIRITRYFPRVEALVAIVFSAMITET